MPLEATDLHRTAKLFFEQGRVATLDEAVELLRTFVLQVAVGPDALGSRTRETALLSIVNSASRAFLGGVVVKLANDDALLTHWGEQRTVSEAIRKFGATITDELHDRHPTIILGSA